MQHSSGAGVLTVQTGSLSGWLWPPPTHSCRCAQSRRRKCLCAGHFLRSHARHAEVLTGYFASWADSLLRWLWPVRRAAAWAQSMCSRECSECRLQERKGAPPPQHPVLTTSAC
eukprot:1084742-Prymnesium_polylepis.1